MIWRVRDRGTFEALGRAPSRAVGPLRLRSVATSPGPPRVAYAVGRPVGDAVARNRLRRRLRAEVQTHRGLLAADTAYLLSAGPRAAAMSASELSDAVTRLLSAPEAP